MSDRRCRLRALLAAHARLLRCELLWRTTFGVSLLLVVILVALLGPIGLGMLGLTALSLYAWLRSWGRLEELERGIVRASLLGEEEVKEGEGAALEELEKNLEQT